MTYEASIDLIVSNVKLLADIPTTDTESTSRIEAFANHYYGMAQGITAYEEIPTALLYYIEDAVLKAWRKRGGEELTSSTALGVSETYADIDEKLRRHLRTHRNPLSTCVTEEEIPPNA